MKKVAILSLTICPAAQEVIEYFKDKEYEIDSVIIEKNFRKKFSANEVQYRKNHDKFNRLSKKYSFIRRMARRFWDLLPLKVKAFVQKKIYYIPFFNRFSLRKFCEQRNIPVFEVLKHSSEETKKIILDRGIDYLIASSSNWLLKEPIISIEKVKIINAHSGWLPKHKGLDSIPWSIKENDKIGLTTHFIDAGIDSGAILKFYEAEIEKGDDFNRIKKKVAGMKPKAFYDTLIALENNKIIPKPQKGKDRNYKPHPPMKFEELLEIEKQLRGQ